MPNLTSIPQPASLSRLAYNALMESILSGQLRPREIYNEMVLARDLGISRTPVREALLELSVQGLVTFLPRKGVVVNQFTQKDVSEIFEVRRAIEGTAVEKLAGLSPPPDLRPAEKAIDLQKRANSKKDFASYLKADRDYHIAFSQLTGNSRIVAIAENLRNMIHLMGTRALLLEGRADTVLKEHMLIVEAILKGRPQQARDAMINHLLNSEAAVRESYDLHSSADPLKTWSYQNQSETIL